MNHRTLWSWSEDEYLKQSYVDNMNIEDIAFALKRKTSSVYRRARYLGLRRDRHNAQKLANRTKLKKGIIQKIR